jgi:NAD(P)H-dependent flavin oxidoreductase YrpB (nitropropane dioxygenase family)
LEMGQSSGLVKEILPAADVVKKIMSEYEEVRKRMTML